MNVVMGFVGVVVFALGVALGEAWVGFVGEFMVGFFFTDFLLHG